MEGRFATFLFLNFLFDFFVSITILLVSLLHISQMKSTSYSLQSFSNNFKTVSSHFLSVPERAQDVLASTLQSSE